MKRASRLRKLVNEGEVFERLERLFGFEAVNPEELDFADQVRLFNEADIVVGAHGSALSNGLFCRPGAAMVQLCTTYPGNLPSWSSSLRELGVNHEFVIGREIAGSHPVRHHWDFLVDPLLLVNVVADLLAARAD